MKEGIPCEFKRNSYTWDNKRRASNGSNWRCSCYGGREYAEVELEVK